MTSVTKAWKHVKERTNQFQLCGDDDAQNHHSVPMYIGER